MVYLLRAVPLLTLCVVFLQADDNVFVEKEHANRILGRMKRANSFSPFEEFWKGNLEGECIEEICSYEEAFEVFENYEETEKYWKHYRGNPCQSNPCQHGGNCTYQRDNYGCQCIRGTEGINCETVVSYEDCSINNGLCDQFCSKSAIDNRVKCSCTTGYALGANRKSCIPTVVSNEDCSINNGRCDQFCSQSAIDNRVKCSCTTGYKLGANRKSCTPTVKFVCGKHYRGNGESTRREKRQIVNTTKNEEAHSGKPVVNIKGNQVNDGGSTYARYMQELYWQSRRMYCRTGDFPWQAMLVNEHNESFCGGTVLDPHFVLTAAHCANGTVYFNVVVGSVDMGDPSRSIHEVDLILLHSKFDPETYEYDIALIKLKEAIIFSPRVVPACIPEENFAENVLMTQGSSYASSFTCPSDYKQHNTKLQLHSTPISHGPQCGSNNDIKITENMFCAASDIICQEGFGSPFITQYKDTYFVTGIASRRVQNSNGEKYGVFTKVSNFITWIKSSMCYF